MLVMRDDMSVPSFPGPLLKAYRWEMSCTGHLRRVCVRTGLPRGVLGPVPCVVGGATPVEAEVGQGPAWVWGSRLNFLFKWRKTFRVPKCLLW